jgi:hypothetical protein
LNENDATWLSKFGFWIADCREDLTRHGKHNFEKWIILRNESFWEIGENSDLVIYLVWANQVVMRRLLICMVQVMCCGSDQSGSLFSGYCQLVDSGHMFWSWAIRLLFLYKEIADLIDPGHSVNQGVCFKEMADLVDPSNIFVTEQAGNGSKCLFNFYSCLQFFYHFLISSAKK